MKETITPIQIRFCDVDKLGHVNNAVYLSYLELARMHYFEDVVGKLDWNRQGIILARTEMDYVKPVLLNDRLFVRTWCSRTGTKSFDLSYLIFKKEDGSETEMVRAVTVLVCFDYKEQKSFPLPPEWRKYLES